MIGLWAGLGSCACRETILLMDVNLVVRKGVDHDKVAVFLVQLSIGGCLQCNRKLGTILIQWTVTNPDKKILIVVDMKLILFMV